MTALLLLAAALFEALPSTPRQGDTVRVRTTAPAETARMGGRTVRLFPQNGGARLGLMPVPVNTRPGVYRLEFLDAAGGPLREIEVRVRDARFPRQNIVIAKQTAALKPAPGEMEAVAAFRQTITDTRYWPDRLAAPLAGCMNSRFGVLRMHNGKLTGNFHSGVDQRSPAGTPIRAVAGGAVRLVRMFNLHGGTVGIDHGQGLTSTYLHMSRFAVKEGDAIKQGDVIGYVGSTGRSTGPHLHWNLFANGVPVNPLQWVALKPCAAPVRRKK